MPYGRHQGEFARFRGCYSSALVGLEWARIHSEVAGYDARGVSPKEGKGQGSAEAGDDWHRQASEGVLQVAA